ncbi:MAG: GMC family oxidoreductase [Alphaproteobacteria bacterium]
MISDGRAVPEGSRIECDLCIIGGGAAGITLAREFLSSGAKVLILESGGLEADADTQNLYDGPQDGIPYPDTLYSSRLRFLGGTTNHWGAWCAPWKESDFHQRSWALNSGWPIALSDIEPYYRKAFALCRLQDDGDWTWDGEAWARRLGLETSLKGSSFEARVSQRSYPKFETERFSFARAYHKDLEASRMVEVLLHANATELVADRGGSNIAAVKVACLSGNRFTVRAGTYVLATGGIENARLLLASRSARPNGIGNEFDNVGRYFMDHIFVPEAARFFPQTARPDDFQLYLPNELDQSVVYCHIGTPDAFLKKERMKDSYIALFPHFDPDYLEASESEGVNSLNETIQGLKLGKLPRDLADKLLDIMTDVDDVVVSLYRKVAYGGIPVLYYDCMVRIDPTPMRESRITLTDEVDALGMPRAKLTWAVHDRDKADIARLINRFGREIGRLNLGRIQNLFDPAQPFRDDLHIGWHHMGTTRMSRDPRVGVVDRNCRVHSVGNLYIAGSSVFRTSGSGTPTMMIVALALRLADHLRTERSIR